MRGAEPGLSPSRKYIYSARSPYMSPALHCPSYHGAPSPQNITPRLDAFQGRSIFQKLQRLVGVGALSAVTLRSFFVLWTRSEPVGALDVTALSRLVALAFPVLPEALVNSKRLVLSAPP